MKKPTKNEITIVPIESLERQIYLILAEKRRLDASIIHALERHPGRFPEDFMFQLSGSELENSRSWIMTSNPAAKMGLRRGKRR